MALGLTPFDAKFALNHVGVYMHSPGLSTGHIFFVIIIDVCVKNMRSWAQVGEDRMLVIFTQLVSHNLSQTKLAAAFDQSIYHCNPMMYKCFDITMNLRSHSRIFTGMSMCRFSYNRGHKTYFILISCHICRYRRYRYNITKCEHFKGQLGI